MSKKLKILIALFLVVILFLGMGIALKNIFLHQIKKKVQASLFYSELRLSVFPLALVLEDVQSISLSPLFSAKKITVKVSYRSLLTREKPLQVVLHQPILKIYASSSIKNKNGEGKIPFPLPFALERGLIKGGEFSYIGKEVNFSARGIKAQFAQKKGLLSLQAEAGEGFFSFGSTKKELQGNMNLSIQANKGEISIKKLMISGPDFNIKAEGSILNFHDPEIFLKTSLNVETPLIADIFDLPFQWEGKAEGEGIFRRRERQISFSSSLLSRNLTLNKVPMGKVWGKLDLKEGAGGTVEFNIQKGSSPQEYMQIQFDGEKIEGVGREFHLEPIIKFTGIPWPVKSPVWGNFSVEDGELNAEVEFREKNYEVVSDKFPLSGRVKFYWNGKNEITFSSQGVQSSFTLMEIDGRVEIGKNVEVNIKGEVFDVREARHFTSVILGEHFAFPEIRGKGRVELKISGNYAYPQVKADFSLISGSFDKIQVHSVEGEAEVVNDIFLSKFRVDDPSLKGEINLISNQESLVVAIDVIYGNIERVLPAFNIQLPLQGKASGRFKVRQKDEKLKVEGVFSSPQIKISGQTVSELQGRLTWEGDVLSFPELQFRFYGGEVKGFAKMGLHSQEFSLDIQGKNLNLSSLHSPLLGDLVFELKGEGIVGQDKASGKFEIKDLIYSPFQKSDVRGEIKLGFVKNRLLLDLEGYIFPGENEFFVSLGFPFDKNFLSANIKGTFRNLDLLLPWRGAKGEINYLGEVKGTKTSPQLKGVIGFKGEVLPLPNFAHAFRNYAGLLFVDNDSLSLRSFKAELGGGNVLGNGEIKLGKNGIENVDVKMEGKDLLLSPLEKTSVLTDGTLRFIKDSNRFALEGDFFIERLYWRREINEEFSFSSSPSYESQTAPGIFDDLTLDIRLRADDNAWLENSLGKFRGRFDLTVSGNIYEPLLEGDIEVLEGSVFFQDRKFTILKGQLSFINPLTIEPYIEFKAETYVKDYRVTISLNGLIDRLNPEFSSSPPLPPEDVLALLAMGEAFKRTYSYDKSTQFSTASLLSFQLAEEAKKRADKLFHIDRFRIDPFVMGESSETTARLTVGKKISRNFTLVYSTNLSTEREELFRVEWELTKDLSVIGIRDEKGRVSFDVKIHKRF